MNRRAFLTCLSLLIFPLGSRADELEDAISRVNSLLRRGQASEARKILKPVAKSNPESATVQYLFAQSYILEKKLSTAQKYLARTVQLDPAHTDARVVLATIYTAGGKVKEARKLLKEVLEREPQRASALRGMGDVELAAKKFSKAAEWYEKALARTPGDARPMLLVATAWSRATVALRNRSVHARKKVGDKAIAAFRKLLKVKADFPEAYYNIGTVAMLCEKFDEAGKALEKYVELRPEDPRAHFNLAQCRDKQDRPADALTAWQKFVTVAEGIAEFRKDRALARRRVRALEKELKKKGKSGKS